MLIEYGEYKHLVYTIDRFWGVLILKILTNTEVSPGILQVKKVLGHQNQTAFTR